MAHSRFLKVRLLLTHEMRGLRSPRLVSGHAPISLASLPAGKIRQSMNGISYPTKYQNHVSTKTSKLVLPHCNDMQNEGHCLSWLVLRMERFPLHGMLPCLYRSELEHQPVGDSSWHGTLPTSKLHSAMEIVAPGDRGTSSSNPELLLRIHRCFKQRLRNHGNPLILKWDSKKKCVHPMFTLILSTQFGQNKEPYLICLNSFHNFSQLFTCFFDRNF